ncbi:MAG: Aminopeptidase YwaD precursor [Candidatus Lokiarchaeum sp. GC14_75]|nr:MAG: Aminopeptidase YwaD precursor [Candidatus Lokiarchaeum sp. GC14_75]
MIEISSFKLYDEQAAISHVKALSFKRQVGKAGETKCINYISKQLNKENIDHTVESFEWVKTLIIMIKLVLAFILIYIFVYTIILLNPIISWVILPLDITFLILLYYGLKFIFDHTRDSTIGKKKESNNVIATFRAVDLYPKRPVIIFSAHHDTTSHSYPMAILMFLYKLGGILMLIFMVLASFLSIWSLLALFQLTQIDSLYLLIRNVSIICGFSFLIVNTLIITDKRSNNSDGSIDNASGVAVLLELAKLIKNQPLKKTDVIFLWIGAKEMGYLGSKQYCIKHFEELIYDYDLDKSYNINIDMVGTYIGLIDKLGMFKKKRLNQNLNDVLKASAHQLKIPLKTEFVKAGSGSSDHGIFRAYAKKEGKKGFQVSIFTSKDDAKFIHSKNDTPEKCSAYNLNGCLEICYNAIKSLDLRVE